MASSSWRLLPVQVTRRLLSTGAAVTHLGLALVLSTVLVLANAIGSPSAIWFGRPVLVLGALLTLHAIAIVAAGRTSRLRTAAVWAGGAGRRLYANVSGWASGTMAPRAQALEQQGKQLLRPRPVPGGHPAPTAITATPAAWLEPAVPGATFDPWTAAPATPAVTSAPPAASWQERPPTWAASWPPSPSAPPATPIRPTGYDTVLHGAQMADPDNPRWDQLAVEASMWLAHRNGDTPTEAAQ